MGPLSDCKILAICFTHGMHVHSRLQQGLSVFIAGEEVLTLGAFHCYEHC